MTSCCNPKIKSKSGKIMMIMMVVNRWWLGRLQVAARVRLCINDPRDNKTALIYSHPPPLHPPRDMLSLFFLETCAIKWLQIALRWLKLAVFGLPLAFFTWKQLLVLNPGGLTIEFLQDRNSFWSNSGNNSTKRHFQAKLWKFLDTN